MSTVIFTRGIPGSGKSTLAQKWVADDPENRVRVNRDDIRHSLIREMQKKGYKGDPYMVLDKDGRPDRKFESRVTEAENNALRKAIQANKDVISDNTNLNNGQLHKRIRQVRQWGATRISYKDFPITVEEAQRRNSLRERKVPDHVIANFYKNLGPKGEFPLFPGSYKTRPIVLPTERRQAILFDMDGTLNDIRNLRHHVNPKPRTDGRRVFKNFEAFHSLSAFEPANESVVRILREAVDNGFVPLITTARQEQYRDVSQKFLDDRNIPFENMFMRANDDSRPDYEVKKDMYDHISMYYDVAHAVDDNPQAVQAWKEKGVRVTEVPFIDDTNMDLVIDIQSPFQEGVCLRCGKPFNGPGYLGPTCRTKA